MFSLIYPFCVFEFSYFVLSVFVVLMDLSKRLNWIYPFCVFEFSYVVSVFVVVMGLRL